MEFKIGFRLFNLFIVSLNISINLLNNLTAILSKFSDEILFSLNLIESNNTDKDNGKATDENNDDFRRWFL